MVKLNTIMERRHFLATLGASCIAKPAFAAVNGSQSSPIKLAIKYNMVQFGSSAEEKFTALKEMGYDGVELMSPNGSDKEEALEASRKTGLPVHGMVNSIHWKTRLTDPSEEVRAKSLAGLMTAIKESHALAGSSVLLVPGVVDEKTSREEAWSRSITEIRKALPLAAELGVHILIENVWNGMFYDKLGGNQQTADRLAAYIDEINSPWVGSYFDIGNHQKFAKPAVWIRTLGKRIVKLDVKDWGVEKNFCKIGEGDIDWADVRAALKEIQYTGWATAEVAGGDKKRCAEILANMRTYLLGI